MTLNWWKKWFRRILRLVKKQEEEISEKATDEVFEVLEDIKYEQSRLSVLSHDLILLFVGPIFRKIWIGNVSGLENIPKAGACIVASNHESFFDFLCFTAVSPRKIHYLSAEKFFKSRFWRPIMKATGQIKVDRHAKDKSLTHRIVLSALEQGRMIGIFPEGTRSPDGQMLKAFTGVAKFALKSKVPVIPVGVIGTRDILPKSGKFPKLNRKAEVHIGKAILLDEYHDKEHSDELLEEVTDKVMIQIANLSKREYSHAKNYIKK